MLSSSSLVYSVACAFQVEIIVELLFVQAKETHLLHQAYVLFSLGTTFSNSQQSTLAPLTLE